jgi:glyoxylase-like metal-dependent hydrolase (beta-lactamase superfamily II)
MLTIKSFVFNPFQENTYILYNEQGLCAVIDPGCYELFEKNTIRDFIRENNLKPVYLLNTHCHIDHVLGNAYIAETYGLKPAIHRADLPTLQGLSSYAHLFGLSAVLDSPEPEIFLEEGQIITLGEDVLEIIYVPGHAPGHVAFICHKQKFVINGDVLFYESIGRTDLPGGDYNTLINSIQNKLYILPDDYVVYCGHGPVTTIGHEKLHNPFVKV